MSAILFDHGSFVLVLAAIALWVSTIADRYRKLIVSIASLVTFFLILVPLVQHNLASLSSLSSMVVLATAIGAMIAMPTRGFSKQSAMSLLLGEGACVTAAFATTPESAAVACVFGLAAVVAGSKFAPLKNRVNVHVFCLVVGYLLLFSCLALLPQQKYFSLGLFVFGLMLVAGVLPFQAGVVDLYEAGDSGQILAFAATPLPWFLMLVVLFLYPSLHAMKSVPEILIVIALLASVASVATRSRRYFLCMTRTSLLTIAMAALWLDSSGELALLSFVAYVTSTVGMTTIEGLAETRVGSALVDRGGLGHSLPCLGGFALFFAFVVANLPFSVNFFASESLTEALSSMGVTYLLCGLLTFGLLGVASYRRYAMTFLGPSSLTLTGIDLGRMERMGLLWIISITFAGAAVTLFN